MQHRVRRVLLVSSLYDSFILSEEGHLHEALFSRFIDLNISNIPDLVRVPDGAQALRAAESRGPFDLIIASVNTGDIDPIELTRRLRESGRFVPVIVLAYSSRELAAFVNNNDLSLLERVFLWQGDVGILLAIIKNTEDRRNIPYDTGVRGIPAIIVVEDNIRFYSSFLPVIYGEIFKHTHNLLSEDLNLSQKMLRMRARPRVLLCSSYEEAWGHFTRYREHILGIISDFEFPRKGQLDRRAGLKLTARARRSRPDIRIVLQSSNQENKRLADEVGASFLLKGSPFLLHQLRNILIDRFGFGDFVFRLPDHTAIDQAHDLKTLVKKLKTVPLESIGYHAERNHFSNWLKARTEFALAEKLLPQAIGKFKKLDDLRDHLLRMISEHREQRNRLVITDFDRNRFEPTVSITRIGSGSLGGKARGIAFVNRILQATEIEKVFPDIDIVVPPSVVLATGVFEDFLEQNDLGDFAIASESDQEIRERFLSSPLPREIIEDLEAFVQTIKYPLAVRSSSLLEDSFAQPFAGVYETYMIPNNDEDDATRLGQLIDAVKLVYASTFSLRAKSYMDMTIYRLEEERMAVIIQQVVGTHHGNRFYPDFAGVARSYNFYPHPPHTSADGVIAMGLGMGRTVVDGSPCLRFCPKYPRHAIGFSSSKDALKNSQRQFFAIDMERPPEGDNYAELGLYGLDDAEGDGTLTQLGSTYLPDDNRVVDGISRDGIRLVSFAQILKHDTFPLAKILDYLLDRGARGTATPVEIEFAATLPTTRDAKPQFGFLQLRPLALSMESEEVSIGDIKQSDLICRSTTILGNGRFADICDIIVVDFHRFERSKSTEIAKIVGSFNAQLKQQTRPYLLIGVGRWGSNDPNLGIPVSWSQISGAQIIVESGFRDLKVAPSQGTHFFQNLTASNVGYFTVNPESGEGYVDWEWLANIKATGESDCVRHLQLRKPMTVKMDGRSGEGVIIKPSAK